MEALYQLSYSPKNLPVSDGVRYQPLRPHHNERATVVPSERGALQVRTLFTRWRAAGTGGVNVALQER